MSIVIPGKGPPCPRCGHSTQIREHGRIGEKELQRPFYYRRWFYCTNKDCKTTTYMREEFKVCSKDNPDESFSPRQAIREHLKRRRVEGQST